MASKMIRFPALNNNAEDPSMAGARFAEIECEELVSVIPAARPAAPKSVY